MKFTEIELVLLCSCVQVSLDADLHKDHPINAYRQTLEAILEKMQDTIQGEY